jgi:hypothetical protein
MPSRDTIVVRNLPETTTVGDIKTFFDTRLKHADTTVFPLVNDSQKSAGKLKCATVELNHAVKDKALRYNGAEFIAAVGGKSKIEIDASLLGPITLAEHNSPEFEFVPNSQSLPLLLTNYVVFISSTVLEAMCSAHGSMRILVICGQGIHFHCSVST